MYKLFNELGPRYAKRPGGYLRILKFGFRVGDNAPMALVELMDRPEPAAETTEEAKPAKSAKAPKAAKEAPAPKTTRKSKKTKEAKAAA